MAGFNFYDYFYNTYQRFFIESRDVISSQFNLYIYYNYEDGYSYSKLS